MTMHRVARALLCLGAVRAFAPLAGVTVNRVPSGEPLDLGKAMADSSTPELCVLGTYAADFNAIEYAQKLKHYWPALQQKGLARCLLVLNASPKACEALATALSLPPEIEVCSDPTGAAGRAYGVGTGWRPDDDSMSPYIKLLGMLVGLGAGGTLPAVITGYFGNPSGEAGWIESALRQGAAAGRWPGGLVVRGAPTEGDGETYAFEALPLVGNWGRRPLELATLRLQNMVGLSLARWGELKPDDKFIDGSGVLTQLGGCVLLDASGGVAYEWKDNGICATADFETLVARL